jgi:hypothetical protein
MYSTVGAKEGKDVCNKADKEGGAGIIATEGKIGSEDVFGVTVWSEVGEYNENGEEADHM